ncbi:MAG: flippase-like domain-containing protein [Candidatus Aenigmarchaeota archaeon]|nr:flippase-like domain-containing protein [Candidatus Aenigmarchaeota archaeon]
MVKIKDLKMKYSKLIGLFGIGLFIYLISFINLELLVDSFKNLDIIYLLISFSFIISGVLIKSLKWRLIINKNDRLSMKTTIIAWISGFGVGLITPAKLGELVRAKFLKSKPGISILTVLVDRFNDILVLFLIGIFAVFVLFSKKSALFNLSYLFILFFVFFIIGVFILKSEKTVKKIGRPFYKFLVPEKFKNFAGENINLFYKNFKKMNKNKIFVNFLLAIFAWFICFAQYWFLACAFGLDISYFLICLITPILILVQLIPISVSGIGTREAAAVLILSNFGISPELAIAFSLGILIEDFILGGTGLIILFFSTKELN